MGSIAIASNDPHTVDLPINQHPKPQGIDTNAAANDFLERLSKALTSEDTSSLDGVLHDDCWWRDHLVMGSWDLRTLHGLEKIKAYLKVYPVKSTVKNLRVSKSFPPDITSPLEGLDWLEFSIAFDTEVASAIGMLRLTQDSQGTWKALLIYTAMDELKAVAELAGKNRPYGGKNSILDPGFKGNWKECRERQKEFLDEDPTVLIIGAGQAGLSVAARLQTLGVTCLLIDRNERVGDNWRQRYRTLSTHDPVHITHMPYIPFPPTWSYFSPKDKLAEFLESYATLMELNVWLKTELTSSSFDQTSGLWSVSLKRPDGSTRDMKPRHVIFATGHSGEPKIPSFPGQQDFKGLVYHGSQHNDASQLPDIKGKKVLVVGTGNSGHDIAQNFYEHGADVTMIQRGATYILTVHPGYEHQIGPMYLEQTVSTEDADLYSQSFPVPIAFKLKVDTVKEIAEQDRELRDGLTKAGFALTMGIDGGGIWRNYLAKGGGYYIDVGCSQLIADGKIKVIQSINGISNFESDKLVLASGQAVPADVVVMATGYDNMRTSLRKALGDEVADQCKDVWGLDEEGELNAIWRKSGHPHLWYMGGNLTLCRYYSKYLALQIKAIELGLDKQVPSK